MRNVVINKIARYVFTESQLKAYWTKLGNDLDFDSLTNDQLMKVAGKMFEDSSHSELEQNIIGRGWRTEDEIEGKMVGEDDTQEGIHIEVIDTAQDGPVSKILVDRVLQLQCKSCSFVFYADDIDVNVDQIKCPSCSGEVEAVKQKRIIKRTRD